MTYINSAPQMKFYLEFFSCNVSQVSFIVYMALASGWNHNLGFLCYSRQQNTGDFSATKLLTFLKNVAGAISAPFRVLRRNIGQEDAFIWNPNVTINT